MQVDGDATVTAAQMAGQPARAKRRGQILFVVARSRRMSEFASETERRTEVIKAAAAKLPSPVKGYVESAAPGLAAVAAVVTAALPYAGKIYQVGLDAYAALEPYHPEDLVTVVFGLFMCFFGGEFPALITAVEAYRQIGFEPTWKALKLLAEDVDNVAQACKADDAKDDDGDGVADVKQISAPQLVERKVLLFLRTSNPETTTEALAAISTGFLAVTASLKLSFARAITLGSAIGDVLRKPAMRYLQPLAKTFLDEDYHKWIVPAITYATKSIAISIAWAIQRVISAFHSAIRGGQMAGKGVVRYLHKYGMIAVSEDDTYADEVAGYALAFAGLAFQVAFRFKLPFPLNLLLFPFTCVEYAVVWIIMD